MRVQHLNNKKIKQLNHYMYLFMVNKSCTNIKQSLENKIIIMTFN